MKVNWINLTALVFQLVIGGALILLASHWLGMTPSWGSGAAFGVIVGLLSDPILVKEKAA